jgi:hypothetical protein
MQILAYSFQKCSGTKSCIIDNTRATATEILGATSQLLVTVIIEILTNFSNHDSTGVNNAIAQTCYNCDRQAMKSDWKVGFDRLRARGLIFWREGRNRDRIFYSGFQLS